MDTMMKELEELLNEQPLCSGSIVKVRDIKGDRVIVQLMGACSGCPGVQITVADSLEAVIKERIPSVQEVLVDNSCDDALISFARSILNHTGQVSL